MSQNLRRHFLVAAGVLIYRPSAALAQQQARRIPQIAWISVTKAAGMSVFFESFRQGLRDLGYIEGNNIIVNAYWADENPERLASLATEIVALRPDVIVANATPAIRAVQQVTTIIPIVMAPATDPVGSGFVTNLESLEDTQIFSFGETALFTNIHPYEGLSKHSCSGARSSA